MRCKKWKKFVVVGEIVRIYSTENTTMKSGVSLDSTYLYEMLVLESFQ